MMLAPLAECLSSHRPARRLRLAKESTFEKSRHRRQVVQLRPLVGHKRTKAMQRLVSRTKLHAPKRRHFLARSLLRNLRRRAPRVWG